MQRAQKQRLVKIVAHNLRDYTTDKHRTVDDRPYGGGAGMIMKLEPIYKAVQAVRNVRAVRTKVILFSAKGRQFDQRMAERFVKLNQLNQLSQLILICGRYEGVDERVAKYIAGMELSVGPYVLTGGEIPAMAVVDAVTRLVPGVIKEESLREESFSSAISHKPYALSHKNRLTAYGLQHKAVGEYPHYTRPEVFYPDPRNKRIAWRVPKVLLSGDHAKIAEWRQRLSRGQSVRKGNRL